MTVLARWKGKLKIREGLLKRARQSGDKKLIAKREQQVADARAVIKRHTPRRKLVVTVAFDGVPTFRGHALMLQDCRDHGWRGRLNSSDRRQGVAERYGKLSQAALYVDFWVKRLPGFAPANRPGQSTHELRSDAVAFRGPVGRPLAWHQLGLDVSEDQELVRIARRLGYDLRHPYRTGAEAHHVNLSTSPTKTLRKRGRA